MLNENISAIRKSKGLSQEELAVKLNVVRQTVSKWEKGLSVPDCDMLLKISEVLETNVSELLGVNVNEEKSDELRVIAEKLEVVNLQLAKQRADKRKFVHIFFIILCIIIAVITAVLFILNSPYMVWDYNDIEFAVMGTIYHMFEWGFLRLAPFLLIGALIGVFLTREK